MSARIVLACLAAALLAAPAAAATPRSLVANLDGDRPWERLLVDGGPGGERVVLVDRCRGERVEHRLSRRWDRVDRMQVAELDGATWRPEIVLDLRDGAGGRLGTLKVVRFAGGAGGCPAPRTLFRYEQARPLVVPPAGHAVVDFRLQAGDYLPLVPGRELRLVEGLFGPRDTALCCPSLERVSTFLYARHLGRYSMVATTLRPR